MSDEKDVIKKLLVDKDINKGVKSPKEESLVSGAVEAVGLNVRCFFKATSNVISSSSPIKPIHVAHDLSNSSHMLMHYCGCL